MRQSENNVYVADRRQFFAALSEPMITTLGLALGTMAFRKEWNEMAS
jgi:hypothetical protein